MISIRFSAALALTSGLLFSASAPAQMKLRAPNLGQSGAGQSQAMPPMGGAMGQPQMTPEQQQLMMATMRVMQAQRTALQDPKIKKAEKKMRTFVEARMIKVDKKAAPKIKRLNELKDKLDAMSQDPNVDRAKAQPLITEAQGIAKGLESVKNKVFAQKAVKKRLDAFQTKLDKKMAEIDPEVPKLIKELKAAQAQMEASGQMPAR